MSLKRTYSDCGNVKEYKRTNFVQESDIERKEKEIFEEIPRECQPQFLNYQLVGDIVSIAILCSKNPLQGVVPTRNVISNNFTHAYWSSEDLKRALKSDKKTAVARNVILSIGYNDCWEDKIGKHTSVQNIEKIADKLRKKGCKELMITNVPPCALVCDKIEHWKYLQFVNEEIKRICSKRDDTFLCDIFKLFCSPRNLGTMLRQENPDYVTFGEANFNVHLDYYNKEYRGKTDLVSFTAVAKAKLNERLEDVIRLRRISLRNRIRNGINTIVLEDDSDEEEFDKPSLIKKDNDLNNDDVVIIDDKTNCDISKVIVIDLDPSDMTAADNKENKNNDGHPFSFECKCEDCQKELKRHDELMRNTIGLLGLKQETENIEEVKTEAIAKDVKPEKIAEVQNMDPIKVTLEIVRNEDSEEDQNFLLSDVKPEILNEMPIDVLQKVKEKILAEINDEKPFLDVPMHEEIILDDYNETADEEIRKQIKSKDCPIKERRKIKVPEEPKFKEEVYEFKQEEIILDENY